MVLVLLANERRVWGLKTGYLPIRRKTAKALAELIRPLPGLIGVQPVADGMMILFETENDAKRALNELEGQITPLSKRVIEGAMLIKDYEKAMKEKRK